ncbi:MAG: alpha/beta hydrolase [Lachnospiraceae bacterium]|nr:alpha/beta hydrolase [Lachnospiraceae bacterium]
MKPKSKLKAFLHKFFKIFIIFMIATAVINVVLFAVIYGNHQSKLKDEVAYLNAPGKFVEVNGHSMHVMIEGNEESEVTLLFLHSADVSDDSVALAPLFKELKNEYRIVFVERSGVGFSENSGSDRDIDTMLKETRLALEKAGVKGPYVVVPVGTAGLEVTYWANMYPEEIQAVIGINITYPEQYADITTEEYCGFFDYLLVPFYKLGAHRFVTSIYPTNAYGVYTDTQMLTRKALISKGGFTEDMYCENLAMVDNANKVAELGWPAEVNMYLIYANPLMEPYRSTDKSVSASYESALEDNPEVDYITAYNESVREYFEDKGNVTVEEMAGPARLYTYNPKGLGEMIKGYIEGQILQ